MIIEKTSKEILFRLPPDTDIFSLQRIINLLKYERVIKKSRATEKQIEKLSDELKSKWWAQNKKRFIK